jgi:hypothetical protein
MNRLAFNRGYLCGAMDRVKDGGIEWRRQLRETLADLQVFWLDPTCKPIDIGVEDIENRQRRHADKQVGEFASVASDMRQIRSVDLRMVDICDFLVVNIDTDIHCCGTYEELFWANRCKKPIVTRIAQGKQNTPDWLLGTVKHELIFSTWEEVYGYIRHIAHDESIDRLGRWYFFDWMGTK